MNDYTKMVYVVEDGAWWSFTAKQWIAFFPCSRLLPRRRSDSATDSFHGVLYDSGVGWGFQPGRFVRFGNGVQSPLNAPGFQVARKLTNLFRGERRERNNLCSRVLYWPD